MRPGEVVAKHYEIVRPLGKGAMGEVYVAKHLPTGERVALKLLRSEARAQTEIVERFKREARAVEMISSTHVPRLIEARDDPEIGMIIALELLEGETLLDYLRRTGRMDLPRLDPIVDQILEALDAAHSVGVVHRDIKLSNVFLIETPSGFHVKLLDFGVSSIPTTAGPRLTGVGTSIGSAPFMPPEQFMDAATCDGRADIYAVGVLVYQALTAKLPFLSDNPMQILNEKLTKPLRSLQETMGRPYPPGLESWIALCLAKERENRFSSAKDARLAWQSLRHPNVLHGALPLAPKMDQANGTTQSNEEGLSTTKLLILFGVATIFVIMLAAVGTVVAVKQGWF